MKAVGEGYLKGVRHVMPRSRGLDMRFLCMKLTICFAAVQHFHTHVSLIIGT